MRHQHRQQLRECLAEHGTDQQLPIEATGGELLDLAPDGRLVVVGTVPPMECLDGLEPVTR